MLRKSVSSSGCGVLTDRGLLCDSDDFDRYTVYTVQVPRGPAEAVAFFVRQSGPLSRTADMPESSAGNTDRQELMSLRRPPGWISV